MHARRLLCTAVVVAGGAWAFALAAPAPAPAFNAVKPLCSVAGLFSGIAGKACTVVQNGGRFVSAGKKLLGGHVGGAVKTALGEGGGKAASLATRALGVAAVAASVIGGARFALRETAKVIARTTAPQLQTTWFSSMYWRVAGISAVLTLPFLFAAAIQALIHSDLSLLLRSALGYLPLAILGVSIAAPVAMLLLAASDQLSAIVSATAGNESAHFLAVSGGVIGGLTALSGSPFLAFLVGLVTIGGALVLWLELLARAAAVYVVVLMLPLAFAALVWPARRIWAVRAVELLVALILSKFAIVAVLSLGGAALGHAGSGGITSMLAGAVLLVMGAFAPWALLRLIPLAELSSGAAGSLLGSTRPAGAALNRAEGAAKDAESWVTKTAEMRREAEQIGEPDPGPTAGPTAGPPEPPSPGTPGGSGADPPDEVVPGQSPPAPAGGPVPASSEPLPDDAEPAPSATPILTGIEAGLGPLPPAPLQDGQ